MPKKKFAEDYEREAVRAENGCLIHPARWRVSRLVYKLRHGALPRHIYVCHTCDDWRCIEDGHFFLGTCKENMEDASQKGLLVRDAIVRKRMSSALKGIPKSSEARANMSAARKGMKLSMTHKANISAAIKGSGNPFFGRKHSNKTKAKISEALRGNKNAH